MEEQKFIIEEVKKHLQAIARKNKYQVIDAVQEMPTFEGFILPYYISSMRGTKYPVNVGGDVYLQRRVGGVLQRDDSQSCASHFGGRTNQGSVN